MKRGYLYYPDYEDADSERVDAAVNAMKSAGAVKVVADKDEEDGEATVAFISPTDKYDAVVNAGVENGLSTER